MKIPGQKPGMSRELRRKAAARPIQTDEGLARAATLSEEHEQLSREIEIGGPWPCDAEQVEDESELRSYAALET